MYVRGECGFEGEAAAVHVEKDGEFPGRVVDPREVNAGGYGGFGGDDDVLGSDPGNWVVGGWDFMGLVEFLDAAGFVYAEEAEFVGYSVVFGGLCRLR